jgi:uncharacterized protein YqgC (DUF456 family)
VLFTLPGNWLMLATTYLFAWWQRDNGIFSVPFLVIVTVMALIGEVIDFFSGPGGAKKAGSGWRGAGGAMLGAMVGGIFGTGLIPIPILGTILGVCFGAGIGTWIVERSVGKENKDSIRSGVGAGTGVLVGILTKFIIGCVIWLLITIAAFLP